MHAPSAVIYPGTVLGEGCVVQDGAILGKPTLRGSQDGAPLVIGDGVVVGAQAIVFAGAEVGDGCIIGDQAYVRERTTIGERTLVGRGTSIDNDVTIGDRVRIQTGVYLTAWSSVEDDVFIGPTASTYNDDTMSRHDDSYPLRGCTLRRASRIGGGAKLRPGIEVGEEAFVAMGAVVVRDVPSRRIVRGVPAQIVGTVAEDDLLENWR